VEEPRFYSGRNKPAESPPSGRVEKTTPAALVLFIVLSFFNGDFSTYSGAVLAFPGF
jgi:hypothetical protein